MIVRFRTDRFGGCQLPVEPGDRFAMIDEQHNLCLEVDAQMIIRLLSCRIEEAKLVRLILASVGDPLGFERLDLRPLAEPEAPMLPPAPPVAPWKKRRDLKSRDRPICGHPQSETGEPCRMTPPCRFHGATPVKAPRPRR